jgi:adhesin transport system outer membrane protein
MMISQNKYRRSLLTLFFFSLCCPVAVFAKTTIHMSVERAISGSPELQALEYNRQALAHDLKRSRSGWLPTIDLTLGYGVDQHSDQTTRAEGADPGDDDWDSREQATLRMTQKIFDGGETGGQVRIGKAKLDSASYHIQAAIQAITLDAVTAHLNVLRQRRLVALSEKNLKAHRDIHRLLAEREQAGAGSIADVTQVRARMAHAESTLHSNRADLGYAYANYVRLTGVSPGTLAYAGGPDTLPQTLDEALINAKQMNPELLAFKAAIAEAHSNLVLARSKFKPKLDLELSSRYNNQMDGEPSWESTHAAMLILSWNMYSGGRDKAGVDAAISRKHKIHSQQATKWIELKETISSSWAKHLSLQNQKQTTRDAAQFSRKTLDAYLHQFSVSQRTLLDVLIAQNEFYQSAAQLVNVYIDETIEAYRILSLIGSLQIPPSADACEDAEEFKNLSQSIEFPTLLSLFSVKQDSALVSRESNVQNTEAIEDFGAGNHMAAHEHNETTRDTISSTKRFSVQIGPYIDRKAMALSKAFIVNQGFHVQQQFGSGPVKIRRMLVGVYPVSEARRRLTELKDIIDSPFVLAQANGLALYAGSFRSPERAQRFEQQLQRKGVFVTEVIAELEMQGAMLIVEQIDLQNAELISRLMSQKDISTKIIPLRNSKAV